MPTFMLPLRQTHATSLQPGFDPMPHTAESLFPLVSRGNTTHGTGRVEAVFSGGPIPLPLLAIVWVFCLISWQSLIQCYILSN